MQCIFLLFSFFSPFLHAALCHFSLSLLSPGGANRRWEEDRQTGRQAGSASETDAAGRPSSCGSGSAWATLPPSGVVNHASPAGGPIFHSQTFATACSAACDERVLLGGGCCHRSYRSSTMSLSGWGIWPIRACSLECPTVSSRCLSAGAAHLGPQNKWSRS